MPKSNYVRPENYGVRRRQKKGAITNWVINHENMGAKYSSVVVCNFNPGFRAAPGHLHPNGEETVYCVSGCGKVMIGEETFDIEPGSMMFFPQNVYHMVWNTSDVVMKIICFYGGPDKDNNVLVPEETFDFPEYKELLVDVQEVPE